MKKLILLLALIVALSMIINIAGCSKKTDEDETTTTKAQTTTTKAQTTTTADVDEVPDFDMSKTLEISWIGGFVGEHIKDGNQVQVELEEMFNVKIINKALSIGNTEAINLMRASGEYPDAGFQYGTPAVLWEQGILRSVPKGFIVKFAPNQAKWMDENAPAWLMHLVPGTDDEYMSVTGGTVPQLNWLPMFRLDWLENVGIEPPGSTTEIPVDWGGASPQGVVYWTDAAYTLDEYEQIFKAFVEDDPNQSGSKDTYAMTGYTATGIDPTITHLARDIAATMGVNIGKNQIEDGQLKMFYATNAYKEFLKHLAAYYKNGYIDPEFSTLDQNKAREKFTIGQVGFAHYGPQYVDNVGQNPFKTWEYNNDAKFLSTAPVKGPSGIQGEVVGELNVGAYNFFVSDKVDDEKLARILQIYDHNNFDDEAIVTFRWGEPGVDFEWSGEPWKSPPVTKLTGNEVWEKGLWFYTSTLYTPFWTKTYLMANSVQKSGFSDWTFDKVEDWAVRSYRFDVFNETDYTEVITQYGSDINTVTAEFGLRAITGDADIDAEWDNYLKELTNAGYDKIIAELEKAPKVPALLEGRVEY